MKKHEKTADTIKPSSQEDQPMEIGRISELVRHLCVTRSNLGLYSFEHSVTQDEMRQTWEYLQSLLADRSTLSLDVHKNTILFEGLPIEERNPLVERLARDFRNLRVRGIVFRQGLTLKELAIFFKMMTLSREVLEKHAGANSLLKELGVSNIGVNQARYVRIEDDQKIVSVSSKSTGDIAGDDSAKKELLHHLWDALMEQKVDREWLLEEIRTDPAQAASQLIGLMKYYDNIDTAEDQQRQQEAMQTLINSVQSLGLRLAERDEDTTGESGETLANSMLQLERELKSRSAGLKTSKAAARFIQEITNTVTAFIDTHQADRIAKEFLKDEKGLKRTEQLLREVVKRDGGSESLGRLKELIGKKGIEADTVEQLIEKAKKEPSPRKKSRRKRATKPIRKKIALALAEPLDDDESREKSAQYLAGIFEREIQYRLATEREKQARMEFVIESCKEAMNLSRTGLVILDEEGNPVLLTNLASEYLGGLDGFRFDEEFIRLLVSGEYRDASTRAAFLSSRTGDVPGRILGVLKEVLSGKEGSGFGLMLEIPAANVE